MTKCDYCGGDLKEAEINGVIECSRCGKMFKSLPKPKTDNKHTILFLTLCDFDIYKTLLLLIVNYMLVEALILFAKYVFEIDLILGIVDFMFAIISVVIFYLLGYKLAVIKKDTL